MSKRKDGRPRNLPNPEFAQAMRELGRSNAAQPHLDKRTKRARSREAQTRRAIEDSSDT